MFQWYAEAAVCYAYLVDIEPITQPDWTSEPECKLAFERSKWWTRGWCLQELIAPRNVEFLASDWAELGGHEIQPSTTDQRHQRFQASNAEWEPA